MPPPVCLETTALRDAAGGPLLVTRLCYLLGPSCVLGTDSVRASPATVQQVRHGLGGTMVPGELIPLLCQGASTFGHQHVHGGVLVRRNWGGWRRDRDLDELRHGYQNLRLESFHEGKRQTGTPIVSSPWVSAHSTVRVLFPWSG